MGKRFRWWQWGKGIGIAYLATCLTLYLAQERLIFRPVATIKITPADFKLAYQEVSIPIELKSNNHEKLFGWWIPAQGKAIGTILYLHGYNENIGVNITPSASLTQLGFNVLLVDYRGYGKSQGDFPSERQLYTDAEIAWNYLVKTRQILPKKIVIFGHSLGGAIAIHLATHHPEVSSLIVQSSFTSMLDVINDSWWSKLVPMQLLLTQKFNSIEKVSLLQMPVLYIHGSADRFLPATMSWALYTATSSNNKQLVLVNNARHGNSSREFNTPEQLEKIVRFIDRAIATKE